MPGTIALQQLLDDVSQATPCVDAGPLCFGGPSLVRSAKSAKALQQVAFLSTDACSRPRPHGARTQVASFAGRTEEPEKLDFIGASNRLEKAAKFFHDMTEGKGWDVTKKLLTDKTVMETHADEYTDIRSRSEEALGELERTKDLLRASVGSHRLEDEAAAKGDVVDE
eukprot:TRINITY_DN13174_c0_g1_i1.p2 TRINITY_DN13174_c0_g1~~TRINITY_DN13174_c0_g1_i1.p2  ORF type:complete len:168 (-),score=41.70 TRINITY_DN13174_c0_g1_i1:200-703(-)